MARFFCFILVLVVVALASALWVQAGGNNPLVDLLAYAEARAQSIEAGVGGQGRRDSGCAGGLSGHFRRAAGFHSTAAQFRTACSQPSTIRNPQSAIRNPSALRRGVVTHAAAGAVAAGIPSAGRDRPAV